MKLNKEIAAGEGKSKPAESDATFVLGGDDLSKVTVEGGTLSTDKKTITFTGKTADIVGLEEGKTYTLKETTAPDGATCM